MNMGSAEIFVVRAGFWRIVLLGAVMLFSALLFFFFALILVFIPVDNLLGKLGLLALALVLALLAIYFVLILTTLAMRVEVGPQVVGFRVPNWRGGVLAWLPWIWTAMPYGDVAAVETRDEVYSSFGMTMVQTAYSVVTKAGQRIVFGYTSPLATWNYKFAEAAALIARKAGFAVTDRGAVRAGSISCSIIKGLPPWDTPGMTAAERVVSNERAARAMQIAFAVVVVALSIKSCVPEHH